MGQLIIDDSLKLAQFTRRIWIRVRCTYSCGDAVFKNANRTISPRFVFVIKRSCSESDVITRYGTSRIENTGAVVEVISSTVAVILALDHI